MSADRGILLGDVTKCTKSVLYVQTSNPQIHLWCVYVLHKMSADRGILLGDVTKCTKSVLYVQTSFFCLGVV